MSVATAILLDCEPQGAWLRLVLHAPALAAAQPGQMAALRWSEPQRYDPLPRSICFVGEPQPALGRCALLLPATDPAATAAQRLARGTPLDALGPLGQGWQLDPAARTLALLGTAPGAPALFALAHAAAARGLAVSLTLGAPSRADLPPAHWLPAAVEYHVVASQADAAAVVAQLDDRLAQWADLLALALPEACWSRVARRVSDARIRWSRGFAQVVVPPRLACAVGVCGACLIETRRGARLACVDGPIFDLWELTR